MYGMIRIGTLLYTAYRPFVISRKNFLFFDTTKGAEASAITFSIIETAKANNLNIYSYLQTLLYYMPGYKDTPEGMENLLPWSEYMQERCGIDAISKT
jgi:hypothetical protein